MNARLAPILSQIDVCLAEATKARTRIGSTNQSHPPSAEVYAILTRCGAAVGRFAPTGSVYEIRGKGVKGGVPIAMMYQMEGILQALRDDYEAGYLQTIEELIHADLFADFLEMAEELQTKGFKVPAAVIAGSVLEEHLRKLAAASGVNTETGGKPKKANTINADLVKAGVYNKHEQAQVLAFLALRNHAAHGEYDEYDHTQVVALIRDVRDFMVRHPA
jgi:hypothetical protein